MIYSLKSNPVIHRLPGSPSTQSKVCRCNETTPLDSIDEEKPMDSICKSPSTLKIPVDSSFKDSLLREQSIKINDSRASL